ncbi:hypothetical protein R3P38DRAFT_3214080 [Favolaschia claudopus]|uniref:Uncharacterized protein n=1 Tax=Favolaschia claudopus TaxID=2862362 RepID=A0AAW0ABW6_9AGAR
MNFFATLFTALTFVLAVRAAPVEVDVRCEVRGVDMDAGAHTNTEAARCF